MNSRRGITTVLSLIVASATPAMAQTIDAGRGPIALTVPAGYDASVPTPLIVTLHGYSGSGEGHIDVDGSSVDRDVIDEPERGDVHRNLRIIDTTQCMRNVVWVDAVWVAGWWELEHFDWQPDRVGVVAGNARHIAIDDNRERSSERLR